MANDISLMQSKKRLDELREMMQDARKSLEAVHDKAAQNVAEQKIINDYMEECKKKREELLNPKPVEAKRPRLYIVK